MPEQPSEAERALLRLIDSPEDYQIPTPVAREQRAIQAEWNAKMRAMYARWDTQWAERGQATGRTGEEERETVYEEALRLSSLRSPPRHTEPYPATEMARLKAEEARLRTELRASRSATGRRAIPQAIKVAVAARDGGRCQCVAGSSCHGRSGMCGSTEEPHYDHIIPWSKGGLDTVDNLQILCGPCNRRKGSDNIT